MNTGTVLWRAGCSGTGTSGSAGGRAEETDPEQSRHRAPVRPNTLVATWAGLAYVCFIIDAFSRMIVGWRVASHMRTPIVLDAIAMARWHRGPHHPDLRCHSDAGSQFTSIRYGERLAEIGAVPSIGSIGDSFDNARADSQRPL